MKLAFLGLGALGAPMAAHLGQTHSLTVWNRTQARAKAFAAAQGCEYGNSPREAVKGAEIVLTCLPTSHEVDALLDGPDGLLAGMAPGSLLLDCTSGDPGHSRRIAARLAAAGIGFADTPVSGGVGGAKAATLTVMVGADPEILPRAEPVLRCFASRIEYMGPVGTGHAMKAVNNALLATSIQAFAEGVTALVRAGISAEKAVTVLNSSSGRSYFSQNAVPERILSGTFTPTFKLALLEKDLRTALDLIHTQGGEAGVLEQTGRQLAQASHEAPEADADYLELIKRMERKAGVEIRK